MWDFLGGIVEWLQERIAQRIALRDTRMNAAVVALQAAALQTNLYQASLQSGKARDATREGELVGLWGSAAGSFFRLNPHFRFEGRTYWARIAQDPHKTRLSGGSSLARRAPPNG
jgi:hypothetical protein